ncbi:aldose 1-epimerase family protein [Sphingomonas sp. HMP6]|uniref:aldose 1-epimerase family protein n=1 Tax=Sphingomonas sp. HMP6 TaxID=1517551 RepID=UPI0015964F81|nr:aldose 1-epimerase family protein [Sphingomonas sp. HMP6]BCA60090.1 aldose 1-epimerase [Sphingomonas sp. HMP6]
MPQPKLIHIATPHLSAAINPLGAELTSLRDADGRELMTNADPAFWTGHAPLLFPIVGRLNGDVLGIDGAEYPMKQHGFARRTAFTLIEHSDSKAVFLLEDSPETRAVYPRAFALRASYEIHNATLSITIEIENRETDRTLPASFGFHPAFVWPLPYGQAREDHRILFEAEEAESIRQVTNGLVDPALRLSPLAGRTLALTDDLFTNDALIWDQLRSHSARYRASTGPSLRIDFPDTPMLGIWTKPGAAFVCIEPWHGIADPQGFTGDIAEKPGIFMLSPGTAKTITMAVTLEP